MDLHIELISIDIGTTNLKLSLVKAEEILAVKEVRYQEVIADKERYLLDSSEIWDLLIDKLEELIKAFELVDFDIVLTSAMHTVQLLDDEFNPVSPLYTWADQTGSQWVDRDNADLIDLYG